MIFGPYIHTNYKSFRPNLKNEAVRIILCSSDVYTKYWLTEYTISIEKFNTRDDGMKYLDEQLKINGHILIDDQEKFDKLKVLA